MIIRSARRAARYTVIANQLIENKSIKADALGLIVYVLSKPDNWNIRTAELQSRFACGVKKIRRMLKELRESNYVEMIRRQSGEVDWIFHETPIKPAPDNHKAKKDLSHKAKTARGQKPQGQNGRVLVSTERATSTERALTNTEGTSTKPATDPIPTQTAPAVNDFSDFQPSETTTEQIRIRNPNITDKFIRDEIPGFRVFAESTRWPRRRLQAKFFDQVIRHWQMEQKNPGGSTHGNPTLSPTDEYAARIERERKLLSEINDGAVDQDGEAVPSAMVAQ